MKHHILGLTALLALALTSCDTSGVKKDIETTKTNKAEKDDRTEAEKLLDPKSHVVDKKSYMNGMKIQWFEKGNGEPLRAGDV